MKVLDKGFVELVDYMGSDKRVVQAARVSTGAAESTDKKDKLLIEYLMINEHWTPFEKIVFEFHVKCPIFIARQWFRHRIGSFNEVSGRYKAFEWECYEPEQWREQGEKRQGGGTDFDFSRNLSTKGVFNNALNIAKRTYDLFLDTNVIKEQARLIMPLTHYTEFYWTVNFRSLANFLTLRSSEDAQKEIQDYANTILGMLHKMDDLKFTMNIYEKVRIVKQLTIKQMNVNIDKFILNLQKNIK